ncbi:isoflavone reductase family protein [Pestalotiopsis sp. NC0098]|nr:isoflavone reductase family protein [Pestalotiopsis sp. NC0098]
MAIKNVALVGANGNLGDPILQALVDSGLFNVTVLKRASSSSSPTSDPNVRVVDIDDGMTFDSLKSALQGQDACIACFPLRDTEQHLRLVDAAAAAGVRRFIPADYGSCDSSSKQAQELVPLFLNKVRVRERCQEYANKDSNFTWTSLVAGHFFDWGLRENFLHFNLKTKTADILDDGTYRSSTSTLARIAEAVVKVLKDEDVGRNKMLFMQSFCVSQLDVLASLEKATGEKWKINWLKSDDFIKENKAKADAGDKDAVEHLVFALGALDGDWEKKDGFAMDVLGLQNQNLDEIVKGVVDESRS